MTAPAHTSQEECEEGESEQAAHAALVSTIFCRGIRRFRPQVVPVFLRFVQTVVD